MTPFCPLWHQLCSPLTEQGGGQGRQVHLVSLEVLKVTAKPISQVDWPYLSRLQTVRILFWKRLS